MTALQRRGWLAAGLNLIYPAQCLRCATRIDAPGGICGTCWQDTPFIEGTVCGGCGVPLEGYVTDDGDRCDDCLRAPRPWDAGRAALLYRGAARGIVLGLKHGDRTDMVPTLAGWMCRGGRDVLDRAEVLVPVPAYWRRVMRRRYNQAALLSGAIAAMTGHRHAPLSLRRARPTAPQERMSAAERRENVAAAIIPQPGRADVLAGRRVCLVDDVLTTGATLSAATAAARAAGASGVDVLVLARTARPV